MPATTTNNAALARGLATGLGWFSIALGVGEILGARQLRRGIRAPVPSAVFSAYGLREIATGVAILASPRPNQMVWARVLGDILDLATLAPTLDPANHHRGAAQGAIGFVAMATLLDVVTASLDGGEKPRPQPLSPEVLQGA